ncbi:hypothetical protein HNP38_000955 [Chryseobacterium defluvii]|uniref:Uncharacterized protein n=1 Tax=Chryseobacterium defluvii TaxID=160396 RepID=A0A840KDR3_9FLAO|nr:hypothetical protein [Chryseobacterium defluvii]MBB4805683.1 hypothetical protein [Chryseobacterium defluvii]
MDYKLLETIADIAYHAGQKGFYSGNSRADIINFIWWAKEFEKLHKYTDWYSIDYILTIEQYTEDKLLYYQKINQNPTY